MLKAFWYEPIEMIAEGLSSEIVEYEARHNYILANQDIETALGIIEKDTIALNNYLHIGRTREGTEIIQEQIWYMDDIEQTRLQKQMDIPRRSGWRIKIEGDVNLIVDIDFPPRALPGRTRRPGYEHHRISPGELGARCLRRTGLWHKNLS